MNDGKRFEQNFKKSVDNETYFLRLQDSANGFDQTSEKLRFSAKSPFDCILFKNGMMYTLELKSTIKKSISFSGSSSMIKQHQIDELTRASKYGIEAGFVFDFRENKTFYLPISAFNEFVLTTTKKSINIKEVEQLAVEIPKCKLKVNHRYDLSVFVR